MSRCANLQYSAHISHRHPYAREHIKFLSFCFALAKQTYYCDQPVVFLTDLLNMRIPSLMAVEISKDGSNKNDERSVILFKNKVQDFIQSHSVQKSIMEKMASILVRLHSLLRVHVSAQTMTCFMPFYNRIIFSLLFQEVLLCDDEFQLLILEVIKKVC